MSARTSGRATSKTRSIYRPHEESITWRMDQWFEKPEIVGDPTEIGTSNLQRLRVLKRVQMRGGARRPHARRTFCTSSVRPRAPTKQMGPFQQPARSLSEKARMTPLTKCLPLGCSRSERGLCPRNRNLGGGSEGGRCPPPSILAELDGHHR